MNATTYAPSFFFQALAHAAPVPHATEPEPLVRIENVVEFLGDDPETHRQVFNMCLDLIVTSLPRLRKAVDSGDIATLCRLAHHARGSLGMLGLPMLRELGEEIEYHYNDLGAERWNQRCEDLYDLLAQLHLELQERLAA
jgi:HPt (histidine-containing phosphotransfer) domain-containing protein